MSANKFITERNHFILLIPFLYAYFSRMRGLRAFGFNALTLWGPGLLTTWWALGWDDGTFWIRYFAGYVIFISIYELGYLLNDTWGLRHDETPRRRIEVDYKPPFLGLFVAIRVLTVIVLGSALSVLASSWFWGLCGLLSVAILTHNFVTRQELKMATFFQMSLMRFSIPVLVPTAMVDGMVVLATGALFFVFPRFVTYLDSKNRLRIPERKNPDFLLRIYVIFGPIATLITLASGEGLTLLLWGYYLTYTWVFYAARKSSYVERLINNRVGNE